MIFADSYNTLLSKDKGILRKKWENKSLVLKAMCRLVAMNAWKTTTFLIRNATTVFADLFLAPCAKE